MRRAVVHQPRLTLVKNDGEVERPKPTPLTTFAIDLSMTSTGVANWQGATTIPGEKLKEDATQEQRLQRQIYVSSAVVNWCRQANLVAIEGPSFASNYPGAHERAGLWWLVVVSLAFLRIPVVVIPPTSLKKYATGNGNASKEQMVAEAIRRLAYKGHSNDEADAVWLRVMVLDAVGQPVAEMPEKHRVALNKIVLPASLLISD